MHLKRLVAIAIFLLTLLSWLFLAEPVKPQAIPNANFEEIRPIVTQVNPQKNIRQNSSRSKLKESINFSSEINQFAPVQGCVLQPPANPPDPSLPAALTSQPISLERFRKLSSLSSSPSQKSTQKSTQKSNIYSPREIIALASASNYRGFQ